jgi:hypothetical protein
MNDLIPSRVPDHWTNAACWKRREKLCIGYRVKYSQESKLHTVEVFAVQNGRTPAPLGILTLALAEWDVFFELVYQNMTTHELHARTRRGKCN